MITCIYVTPHLTISVPVITYMVTTQCFSPVDNAPSATYVVVRRSVQDAIATNLQPRDSSNI